MCSVMGELAREGTAIQLGGTGSSLVDPAGKHFSRNPWSRRDHRTSGSVWGVVPTAERRGLERTFGQRRQ